MPQTVSVSTARLFVLFSALSLSVLLFGCDPCAKLAKSTDTADRDSAAFCYFEREKYEPASQIFSELLGFYTGDERGEKILYYLASSKMYMGEMITAGYFFEQFIKTYPNSEYTPDATYFRAYVYYLMSDDPELDQTETYKAIEFFQFFLKVYPENERA
ncbi:MAG: outer membrane protein assembly factor BamD [Bacteroidota bacterium]